MANKKKYFFIEHNKKFIFIFLLITAFLLSSLKFMPHIVKDIKFTYKIHNATTKEKKLNILYNASNDPYLFFISASSFLRIGIPYYLKKTIGVEHIPDLVKENFENREIVKNNISKNMDILRKKLLIEAKKLEKIHKAWFCEYYLGIAYLVNDNLTKAKKCAIKGIAINDNSEDLRKLLHYVNVLGISRKTGKPVKELLPTKQEIEDLMKQMFSQKKKF